MGSRRGPGAQNFAGFAGFFKHIRPQYACGAGPSLATIWTANATPPLDPNTRVACTHGHARGTTGGHRDGARLGGLVERGGGALLVPVGGEVARWSAQPLEHPVVADSVHSESPSDVVENDVQLAVVVLDVATSGWLIDASAAEERGPCPGSQ